jgi:hypothetical protein
MRFGFCILTIGFIKTDIEGHEREVSQGAIATLGTQQPFLSISTYHNIELVAIRVSIEKIGGYRIEFENHGYDGGNMYEQVILISPIWLPSH